MAGHYTDDSRVLAAQVAVGLRAGYIHILKRLLPATLVSSLLIGAVFYGTGQSVSAFYSVAVTLTLTGIALPYCITLICLAWYGRQWRLNASAAPAVIHHLLIGRQLYRANGHGYGVSGTINHPDGKPLTGRELKATHQFFIAAAVTSPAHLVMNRQETAWQVAGKPTDGALLALARKAGVDIYNLDTTYPMQNKHDRPSQSELFITERMIEDVPTVFIRGTSTAVLAACTKIQDSGTVRTLTKADHQQIDRLEQTAAKAGGQVMALAYRPTDKTSSHTILLGAVIIYRPPLPAVHKNSLTLRATTATARTRQINLLYGYGLLKLITIFALMQPLSHFAPVITYPKIIILGLLIGAVAAYTAVHTTVPFHVVPMVSRRLVAGLLTLAVACTAASYLLYFAVHRTSGAFITPGSLIHRQASSLPFIFITLLTTWYLVESIRQKIKMTGVVFIFILAALYVPGLSRLFQAGPLVPVDWLLLGGLFAFYTIASALVRHAFAHSRTALFKRHNPETIRRHLAPTK